MHIGECEHSSWVCIFVAVRDGKLHISVSTCVRGVGVGAQDEWGELMPAGEVTPLARRDDEWSELQCGGSFRKINNSPQPGARPTNTQSQSKP